MNAAGAAAVAICAAATFASLLGLIVPNGTSRRLLNSVMGCFVLCALIVPLKNLSAQLGEFSFDMPSLGSSSPDEAYSDAVLTETENILESGLVDLLSSGGYSVNSVRVVLKNSGDKGIIIEDIRIYLNRNENENAICTLVREKYGVYPIVKVKENV